MSIYVTANATHLAIAQHKYLQDICVVVCAILELIHSIAMGQIDLKKSFCLVILPPMLSQSDTITLSVFYAKPLS